MISFFLIGNITAQEIISPLQFNPAYPQQSNLRQNVGLDLICDDGIFDFMITETINPACQSDDGSIEILVNAGDDSFDFYLNSELVGNSSNPSFTFENLTAGPYTINVIGNSNRSCQQFTTLNNAGVQDINVDLFITIPAFCGDGRLEKAPGIDTTLRNWNIFTGEEELVGTLNNFFGFFNLAPGDYYIIEQGASDSCQAFLPFTIDIEIYNNLPFTDDFADELIFPKNAYWADKQAFINRTFALNPWTLGVATLDGLDDDGRPYVSSDVLVNGSADSLTSRPFCLDGVENSDSLYLSFLFQAQGISDFPDEIDSLFVEIKDDSQNWHTIWSVGGLDTSLVNDEFTQVILPVIDDTTSSATFFFNGFQFRFRNTATITGINDPWHLDYIQLDTAGSFLSRIIQNDFAHVYDMRPILKNYSAMPWDQFYNYQDEELIDSLRFTFRINDNDPASSANIKYEVFELCDSIDIASDSLLSNINGPLSQTNTQALKFTDEPFEDLSEGKDPGENIVVRCDLTYAPNSNDNNAINDKLQYNQIFSNYYSYDDGTAERAYGLLGNGAQIAVEFDLNEEVWLKGIQIYFTHIVGDVSANGFDIKAWYDIDKGDNDIARDDSLIAIRSGLIPIYTGEVGGFTTYLFEDSVKVDSTFYIGMEQYDKDILNIGFDVNNVVYDTSYIIQDTTIDNYTHLYAGEKTFYNTNGVWLESIIPGAIMIRPIVGPREVWQTGISEALPKKFDFKLYPNPAENYINIDLNISSNNRQDVAYYSIFDFSGRKINSDVLYDTTIDIGNLGSGMYILQLEDQDGKSLGRKKFVKY